MRPPRFRNLAAPLGILMFTAILGWRIARSLRDELGDAALWLWLGLLLAGLVTAIWMWRGRAS